MTRMDDPARRRFLGTCGLAAVALAGCRPADEPATGESGESGETNPRVGVIAPTAPGAPAPAKEPVRLDDLTDGEGRLTEVDGQKIYVIRHGQEAVAFGATCTHNRCTVKWNATAQQFQCPCHQSVFDANGQPLSGPAKTALPSYPTTLKGGVVEVG